MDLIKIEKIQDTFVLDSRLFAEGLDIQHKTLVETITKYEEFLIKKGDLRSETYDAETPTGGKCKRFLHFWLNQRHCIFLGTLSRNTEKVVKFKDALETAFYELSNPITNKPKTALELAREQVLLLEDLERKKELIAQQEKDLAMQRLFLQVKEEVIQKQDVILTEQTNKLEEQKPKVEFYDAVRESETNITFNQYAKILSNKLNNKLPSMGDITLFEILRDNGFLMSHSKAKDIWNIPYQRFINQGIFAVIEKSYGKNTLYTQTLITPKGQQYLFKWFTEKYIPKVIDIADYQQPVEEMTISDHIAEIEKMNQSS